MALWQRIEARPAIHVWKIKLIESCMFMAVSAKEDLQVECTWRGVKVFVAVIGTYVADKASDYICLHFQYIRPAGKYLGSLVGTAINCIISVECLLSEDLSFFRVHLL